MGNHLGVIILSNRWDTKRLHRSVIGMAFSKNLEKPLTKARIHIEERLVQASSRLVIKILK